MQSSDYQRDEALKAKRRDAESGTRADRPNRLRWASVLGNAAVQRLLRSEGVHRAGAGPNVSGSSIARAVQPERSAGQSTDATTGRDGQEAEFEPYSRPERCCPGANWDFA